MNTELGGGKSLKRSWSAEEIENTLREDEEKKKVKQRKLGD